MPLQNTTLSFAQLDARANQLARHLIQLGAAPERPIGILMRRSLDLFTGLVAILKSGSAYVPMDPDYPPDRLAIMAGDSKACFPVPGQHCFMRNTCLSEPCRNKCPQCHLNAGEVHSYSRSPSKMLSVSVALLQAPVILSQVDLEGKVSEVLAAVEKDRQATGSIESVPKGRPGKLQSWPDARGSLALRTESAARNAPGHQLFWICNCQTSKVHDCTPYRVHTGIC